MNVTRHLKQAVITAVATCGVLVMTAAYVHVVLPTNEHPWMGQITTELSHGVHIAQGFFLGNDILKSTRFAGIFWRI